MIGSWWVLWIMFMLVFLVPPLGYGWGYRGWGPPYPRYVERRRGSQAAESGGGSAAFDHYAWGWGGDLVWMIFGIGMFLACTALWVALA